MSLDFNPLLQALKSGGVILHRPDTIWGLSCDARNPEAVKRIDQIKDRPEGKSYIVLVANEAMVERHVRKVPEVAYDLIEASLAPLTIIYPEAVGLAPGVAAADGSIAIRVVKDKLTHDIIHRLGRPIISSSANISGVNPPTSLDQVSESIKESVDLIVEREDSPASSKASTIIKLALNGEFTFIRS